MLVYIINKHGKPLMPTNPRKARILLKQGKAKVTKRTPFTIQLLHGSSGYKQEITLGVDAGSKTIGFSAVTDKEELFSAEVQLRTDIVELLSTRRQNRRTRRNRKTRYRQARYLNRVSSKKKCWLAPSILNKINTHLKVIENLHKLLPIAKIIVEVASFDIQKIKNPDIQGEEYQQGEQLDFWNVRQYVLHRDNHQCQGKKTCKNKILNVHHIESRKVGGDRPENLITLCTECHNSYHSGKLKIDFKKRRSFKDAAFMGIMRWAFYGKLKQLYKAVSLTYGYITKNTRITNQLEKSHRVDARCIANVPLAIPAKQYYTIRKVRCHNRQIHKANILKGGNRKLNQAQFEVKGFRLFDKVVYNGKEYFVFGRRNSGYFDIRTLDGIKVNKGSLKCELLKLVEFRRNYLWERRLAIPPRT